MKLLCSSSDGADISQVRKKLFAAGIRCQVRQDPGTPGVFGTQACSRLWVMDDGDFLKALKLSGASRLRQMATALWENQDAPAQRSLQSITRWLQNHRARCLLR